MSAPVALVTGAARGIGAAVVRRLVADGYQVVAVDAASGADDLPAGVTAPLATPEELDAVAAPAQVRAVRIDVRDRDALREAVGRAAEELGGLDVVVAAAAVVAGGRPLWETPPEDVAALLDVNATGVLNTAAATVPHLLAAPDPSRSRFVAVASAAGTRGLFHLGGYVVSKHAVVGVVRALAADLVGTGVTAVAVSPGSTDSPMLRATAQVYGLEDPQELASAQLLHRLLDPDEVAATIAFCCSREGAVLNGSVVSADGGFAG